MQSPSSLIFLVLLGVWAAYFAQYWLRRRDHLATARSVEQFSEAMRVLERRPTLPRTDLSEPAPRSYAVHPARSARPQVIVKRAVTAEPAPTAESERRVPEGQPVRGGTGHNVPADRHPARDAGSGGRRGVRPSRRLRGLVLLTSLVSLLVVVPLVVLALLPLWAPAPAVVAVLLAFLWVRSAVRAEQALARARRRRPAQRRTPAVAAPADTALPHGDAAVGTPDRGVAAGSGGAAAASDIVAAVSAPQAPTEPSPDTVAVGHDEVAASATATGPDGGPGDAVVEPRGALMVPIVDEDDIPLTWDPVPVPRPTYTMKAKAERPEVEPAATSPDPVRHEGPGEDRAYDQRRVAGA